MRYILLVIGSVLAVLFILQLKKGKDFESLVENLDDNAYPLHELYSVGFAWSHSTKLLEMKGKIASNLRTHATLLYEPQYAEYYANVAWAQAITLIHLFLTMTFLIAGVLYDMAGLMLIAGVFLTIVIAVYSLENMKNTISARTEECEAELPEVVSTIAILVNSGI